MSRLFRYLGPPLMFLMLLLCVSAARADVSVVVGGKFIWNATDSNATTSFLPGHFENMTISVTVTGSESSVAKGSKLKVELPEGFVFAFANMTSTGEFNATYDNVTALLGQALGSGNCSQFLDNGNIEWITDTYKNKEGKLIKVVTGFIIPTTATINSTSENTTFLITNSTSGLVVAPIFDKIDAKPVNECGKIKVTLGDKTVEGGKVCALWPAQIADAVLDGDRIKVTFLFPVDQTTVDKGDFTNVTVSDIDTWLDEKTVVLKYSGTINAGVTTISLNSSGDGIANVNYPDFKKVASKEVYINPPSAKIESVTLNKDRVGTVWATNSDTKSTVRVTIESSADSPLFLRVVPEGTTKKLVFNGDEIEVPKGWKVSDKSVYIQLDKDKNTGLNPVDLTFNMTNNGTYPCKKGDECTVEIQVSTQPTFVEKTVAKLVIDQRAPYIEKVEALSNTEVKVTFSEPMDKDSVKKASDFKVCKNTCGDSGCAEAKDFEFDEEGKVLTLTTTLLPTDSDDNKLTLCVPDEVTDKAGNKLSTTSKEFPYVVVKEITSVEASNHDTGTDIVPYKDGKLDVTVKAVSGHKVYVRVVDAEDTSRVVSENDTIELSEVEEGVYKSDKDNPIELISGITSDKVVVLASTDPTFKQGVVKSAELKVDKERPVVKSACWVDKNHVKLCFSEPMYINDELKSTDSYQILKGGVASGVQVVKVEPVLEDTSCVLITTTDQEDGVEYTLDVEGKNIEDLAGLSIKADVDAVGKDRATWVAGEPCGEQGQEQAQPVPSEHKLDVEASVNSGGVYVGEAAADGVIGADESLDLKIEFPKYAEPVDVYVAFGVPSIGVVFFKADGSAALFDGSYVPYAENVTEVPSLDFGQIPVKNPLTGQCILPAGDYVACTLVVPAGTSVTDYLSGEDVPGELTCYVFKVECE